MPLYDFLCLDCGKVSEALLISSTETAECSGCGSTNVKRILSASSSLSGAHRQGMPGLGDTSCCGSAPEMADGCSGPGSCCGHRH